MKRIGLLLVISLLTGLIATSLPAWASCSVSAQQPDFNDPLVSADGGHSDCASGTTSTVRLKHQKWGPDSVLASDSDTGSDVWLTPSAECLETSGNDEAAYYTEVTGDAGSAQSSNLWLDC